VNVGFGYEASTNGAGAEAGLAAQAGEAKPTSRSMELARTRPELLVGAAFAGGLIAAFLLRRLGR
jgi:hypothetical protein